MSDLIGESRLDRIAEILCRALYRIVTRSILEAPEFEESPAPCAPSSRFRLDFPAARSEGCKPRQERLTGERANKNGRMSK